MSFKTIIPMLIAPALAVSREAEFSPDIADTPVAEVLEPFRKQWAVVDADCRYTKYNSAFEAYSNPTSCPRREDVPNVPWEDWWTDGWEEFCDACPFGCVAVLAQRTLCFALSKAKLGTVHTFVEAAQVGGQMCSDQVGVVATSPIAHSLQVAWNYLLQRSHTASFDGEMTMGLLGLATSRWIVGIRLARLHALCAGWWDFLKFEHWQQQHTNEIPYVPFNAEATADEIYQIEHAYGFSDCLIESPNDPEAVPFMLVEMFKLMRTHFSKLWRPVGPPHGVLLNCAIFDSCDIPSNWWEDHKKLPPYGPERHWTNRSQFDSRILLSGFWRESMPSLARYSDWFYSLNGQDRFLFLEQLCPVAGVSWLSGQLLGKIHMSPLGWDGVLRNILMKKFKLNALQVDDWEPRWPLMKLMTSQWPFFEFMAVFRSFSYRTHTAFSSPVLQWSTLQSLLAPVVWRTGQAVVKADAARLEEITNTWTLPSFPKQLAYWLLHSGWLNEPPDRQVLYFTSHYSQPSSENEPDEFEKQATWIRGFIARAAAIGIPALLFITPDPLFHTVCQTMAQNDPLVFCWFEQMDTSDHYVPVYEWNNRCKFSVMPMMLAMGLDIVWLDTDILVYRDPTDMFVHLAKRGVEDDVHTSNTQCKYDPNDHFCMGTRITGDAEPIPYGNVEVDLLVTDHFNRPNLNNGLFYARATDSSLMWWIHFVSWLSASPLAHDGDAYDGALNHSLMKPFYQEIPNPPIRYRLLSVARMFLQSYGWLGGPLEHVYLMHYLEIEHKLDTMFSLFKPHKEVHIHEVTTALLKTLAHYVVPARDAHEPGYYVNVATGNVSLQLGWHVPDFPTGNDPNWFSVDRTPLISPR